MIKSSAERVSLPQTKHARAPERDYLEPGHSHTLEQKGITWDQDMHIHLNRITWDQDMHIHLNRKGLPGPGHAHTPEQNRITWARTCTYT